MTDVQRKKWLNGHQIGLLGVMVMVLVTLTGCQPTSTAKQSRQINVVATLGFYGEAAQAILGHSGHVTTVINSPSIDAESYEPDIKTAKQVARADVVVENGLGYDSWMDRVVAANQSAFMVRSNRDDDGNPATSDPIQPTESQSSSNLSSPRCRL